MTRQHIRLVRPKYIRISSYRSGVVVPFLSRAKSSHVIPDTHDLFLSQSVKLGEKHDRFIPMAFQKGVRVIFVVVRVFNEFTIQSDTLPLRSVLVNFAKVMEHSHQIGGAVILPLQLATFGQANQVFCHSERVVKEATFIIPVVFGGSRSMKKAVYGQVI